MRNIALIATIRRIIKGTGGNVAVLFSLVSPVLILSSLAALDYTSLTRRQTVLQAAVDSAALAGARELGLAGATNSRIESVARSIALSKTDNQGTTVTAKISSDRTEPQVSAEERVQTILEHFVSSDQSTVKVQATGKLLGANAKLCMLGLDANKSDIIHLHKKAQITAPGCLVQANSTDEQAVHIEDNAQVTADRVCSGGGYKLGKGALMSRNPETDCPVIKDPLASRAAPPMSGCTARDMQIDSAKTPTAVLTPGTYCGGLKITNNAAVTLLSGIYVIDNGPLVVDHGGALSGTNVGFYFTGDKGGLLFDVKSTISLTAPKDGSMAGLLFFENRSVSAPVDPPTGEKPTPPPPGSPPMRVYRIVSDNARNLLGTIYLPAGRIIVDANKPVADRSAYTVIVARQIELFDGPNLYLNVNYSGTDVPVPSGVGPGTASQITLAR